MVLCSKWEENHRKELKEKRTKSEQKKVEALKEGEKLLDKFFKERQVCFSSRAFCPLSPQKHTQ